MMNGQEKSDSGIVAGKRRTRPGNWRRSWWSQGRGPRGTRNSNTCTGHRAGLACSQSLDRVRKAAKAEEEGTVCRQTPEVGATCGKAARVDLRGGRSVMSVPTAKMR
jgi:hypothetical protein